MQGAITKVNAILIVADEIVFVASVAKILPGGGGELVEFHSARRLRAGTAAEQKALSPCGNGEVQFQPDVSIHGQNEPAIGSALAVIDNRGSLDNGGGSNDL